MLTPLLSSSDFMRLMRLVKQSRRIVICGHRGPDGDAVGASLGWAAYLRGLGKQVNVAMPNPFPDFLRWMPGARGIAFYDRQPDRVRQWVETADLICCLDFNAPQRLENMAPLIAGARAERLMIDHHLAPDTEFASFCISHPEKSSTSELVFRLIHRLGGFESLSTEAAVCLYTGMMTDTGGFTYNSSDPEIYLIIGQLLTKGFDKDRVYRNVFHNYSPSRLRLMGYLLYEKLQFLAGGKACYFTLTREEMKRFEFVRGDAEGFVNLPLQVRGLRLSISLREDTESDVVRVSLRSVDDFPCNRMAEEFFNGGGHLNASGGSLPFPLSEAEATVRRAVEAYADLL